MVFKQEIQKTSLQTTIPENLDNNEDGKRDIHRPNLQGSRKRQYLPSKLKAWVLLGGGLNRGGRARRGAEKNVELNKNQ